MLIRFTKTLLLGVLMLSRLTSLGQGFLKAQGPQLVDGSGKKIVLRGMGLGGWMLQEGYMFRLGNIGQQYRIKAKITDVIGAENAAKFYAGWLANHTRRIDVDSMAA